MIVYRSAFKNDEDFYNLCKALGLPLNCWKIELDIITRSAAGFFGDNKKEVTYENFGY